MVLRLLLAGFLLAHAGIHAGFLSPRPQASAGPAWPFELGRSWALTPLGLPADAVRLIGVALVAATIGGFALAAIAALGVVPAPVWVAGAALGEVASIALLLVFFHPWLVLGLAIDAALLWVVLVADWTPDRLAS